MRNLACTALLTIALVSTGGVTARGADLQPKTVAAFDRYVAVTERQMDSPQAPALLADALPEPRRAQIFEQLRQGSLVIERRLTKEANRDIDVPDGLIHHWVGTVFVPGSTADAVARLLQNYDQHSEIYAPAVQRSKLLTRDGDRFTMFMRFYQKKVIAVVVNSEHEARFYRPGPGRVSGRIHSTRINEVEDPGTPSEREKPVGRDGGYLWRLNTYWRLVERDGGVSNASQ
jgi:hypothetical protein